MATLGYAETSLRQDELTETTENREHDLYWREDDLIKRPEQQDLCESRASFSSRQKLIAGIAVVAALGVCACMYFLLAFSNDKTAPQTAEVTAAVQPVPASLVQTALNTSGSSAEAAGSESSSSKSQARPAELIDASQKVEPIEASEKLISAALPTPMESPKNIATRSEDILFLQRPGVNIRSTPSKSGSALGTAPKGTRFKVTGREADWVKVQNGRLSGWVNAQFLAPTEPR